MEGEVGVDLSEIGVVWSFLDVLRVIGKIEEN